MATGDRPTYPPDEFDRIPRSVRRLGGRRGAHRPRSSRLGSLLPALLVVVAVVAVVLGVAALLSTRPPKSAATPDAGSTQVNSATPSPSTPSSPGATVSSSGLGTTDGATRSAPGTTTPTKSGAVDREASVRVVNATSRPGLAGAVGQTLIQDGWNVSGLGNHGEQAETTTVYYGKPALRATAAAVARDLGVTSVRLDAQVTQSVTVVLGADFRG